MVDELTNMRPHTFWNNIDWCITYQIIFMILTTETKTYFMARSKTFLMQNTH